MYNGEICYQNVHLNVSILSKLKFKVAMKNFLKNIHEDIRLSAIFCGVTSSLATTPLWNYSWATLT